MGDDMVFEVQRHVWTVGDYPAIARRLAPISHELVIRLGIGQGDRVLDVATGDGNAAFLAAGRGAAVTGVDLTPAQIDRASARGAELGLTVDLRVGNAEQLDVPDGSFDVVMSVMGMIFAPDHHRAAAEMVRACRSGGRVGITSWAPGGFFGTWRDRISEFVPDLGPGQPDPDGWAEPSVIQQRFAEAGLEIHVEVLPFTWEFGSGVEAIDFFLSNSGPFILFMDLATAQGFADEARTMLLEAIDDANTALDGSVRLHAPYTLAVGTR